MTQKEKEGAIIIRNIPDSVRRKLKSKTAMNGDSMQGVILKLMQKYIEDVK